MRPLVGWLVTLLVAASPRAAVCLEPGRELSQYVVQRWTIDEGLPQGTVYAVAQSSDGYVWAATQEGFVRFDGVRFDVFDRRNLRDLRSNFTLTLLAGRDGSVYVGTDGGGLVHHQNGRARIYTTADGLPSDTVTALAESSDGSLWIGTQQGVARRTADGTISRLSITKQLPHATITALAEDWSGRLWIGTTEGLASFASGGVTRHEVDGFPATSVFTLAVSRDGSVWIGTRGHGLHRYRSGKFRVYTRADGLVSRDVSAVYEDRHGTIWIGTVDRGLGRFANERLEFPRDGAPLVGDVSSIFEDGEGNLWIGGGEGLARLTQGRVTNFATSQGLAGDNVRSLHAGRDGAVWVAAGKGIQMLGRHEIFGKLEGLSSESVMTVFLSSDGSRWAGTYDSGLVRITPDRRITLYDERRGLLSNTVLALYEDRAGAVWVGTARGLQPIVGGEIRPAVLTEHPVSAILQDRSGAIWAGTQDSGAMRIQGQRSSTFRSPAALSADFVTAFHEDSDGALWVGTAGGGLNRFKNGKWTALTTREGLFDDTIMAILEDGRRVLWMSTNKGIFRISRDQLAARMDGAHSDLSWVAYDRSDGMGSRECNGGTQPVAGTTPDGRLWFATTRGVAMIDPREVTSHAVAPPILIQRMMADRQPLDPQTPQSLPPGTKTVEFHYAGLHFAAPDKIRYQYRLEGFDEAWVDAGPRRVAYYTNLSPGDYRFQVRARIADGPWNGADTAALTFRPFIYRTAWFWTLVALLLVCLAALAHRSRVRLIRASAERFKLLFDRNLAGVYRATADGRVLDCNDACARIFGFESRNDFIARGLMPPYWNESERQTLLQRLRESGSMSNVESSLRRADGTRLWVLENISIVEDADGREILEATLIDITERRTAEEKIRYQAFHDGLTGLPNRALLHDRLTVALAHSQRHAKHLAVLYLDLDRFKAINDTFGHTVGDDLLQAVADRLVAAVREEDSVARVGGDEFILLLSDLTSVTDAVAVARKILQSVARPFSVDGRELYITTSIGIAVHPADGDDAETLLKHADTALYRAKDSGRNTYHLCSPSLNRQAAERLAVETSLRHALERREFLVHYQPQLDVRTGRFTAVEALIRWDRPGKGIVRPASFIPVAEETRLIVDIGEWVLETACHQARMWQCDGVPLRVAVNFSARQFQQPDLVQTVRGALDRSGLDPRRLEIEITESTAMHNPDLTADILGQLKLLGVNIAIDDFGVGHSSLNYLKRFPIDAIKIDRSFVQDIHHDESDAAIVSAVIAMARALKLRVIAEGVETTEQMAFLQSHGCVELQGYLLSRPLPADGFPELLREDRPRHPAPGLQHAFVTRNPTEH